MTVAVAESSASPVQTNKGQGAAFELLWIDEQKVLVHANEPILSGGWKRVLSDQAMEIVWECSTPEWDGYDALPISRDALSLTLRLIHMLPNWVPQPDLVPSPEGEISFEWHSRQGRILSVTPNNEFLVYAAFLGPDHTQYGRNPVHETWPEEILMILSQFFHNGYFFNISG